LLNAGRTFAAAICLAAKAIGIVRVMWTGHAALSSNKHLSLCCLCHTPVREDSPGVAAMKLPDISSPPKWASREQALIAVGAAGVRLLSLSAHFHAFRNSVIARRSAKRQHVWRWRRAAQLQSLQFEILYEVADSEPHANTVSEPLTSTPSRPGFSKCPALAPLARAGATLSSGAAFPLHDTDPQRPLLASEAPECPRGAGPLLRRPAARVPHPGPAATGAREVPPVPPCQGHDGAPSPPRQIRERGGDVHQGV
jgi:hypothetical protein